MRQQQAQPGNHPVVISKEIISRGEKELINCHTEKGEINVELPLISTLEPVFSWGFEVIVYDADRKAGTNKIVIKPGKGDKIASQDADIVIKTDGGAMRIFPVSQDEWKAIPLQ